MSLRQPLWRTSAVLFIILLLSGCAARTAGSAAQAAPSARSTIAPVPSATPEATPTAGPPAPPPGQMALSVSLNMGGYDAATRDMLELDVAFTIQSNPVQFSHGESVTCNGVALPGYGTNFDLKVPSEVFSGKLVTCTYAAGKTSATFSFTCPLAPAIFAPQEHAKVPHSKQTAISYRISQDQPFYLIAIGPGPTTGTITKAWTPTGTSQPNPAILNTSAFQPGVGDIALTQFITLSDLRSPDFRLVQSVGNAEYEIEVTWV